MIRPDIEGIKERVLQEDHYVPAKDMGLLLLYIEELEQAASSTAPGVVEQMEQFRGQVVAFELELVKYMPIVEAATQLMVWHDKLRFALSEKP